MRSRCNLNGESFIQNVMHRITCLTLCRKNFLKELLKLNLGTFNFMSKFFIFHMKVLKFLYSNSFLPVFFWLIRKLAQKLLIKCCWHCDIVIFSEKYLNVSTRKKTWSTLFWWAIQGFEICTNFLSSRWKENLRPLILTQRSLITTSTSPIHISILKWTFSGLRKLRLEISKSYRL